jgi:hypothetical protein
MGTPDSPVVHRTWHCSLSGAYHISIPLGFGAVDHWRLLSSCCTGQSGGTPDNPVCSGFVALTSDFCSVHLLLFTTVDHWRSWSLLRWLTGHVRCTPDSPVNYSGATPRESRERAVRECLGLSGGVPLAALLLVFAPNFVEFLTYILCWSILNFVHLR